MKFKLTVKQMSMLFTCAKFIYSRRSFKDNKICFPKSDKDFIKKSMHYDTHPKYVKDILDIMLGELVDGIKDKKQKLDIIKTFETGMEALQNPPHWYVDGTAYGCNCDKCIAIRGKVDRYNKLTK